jgi:hypothetical protein
MRERKVLLSKSQYMDGLSCPTYLWFDMRANEADNTPDLMTVHLMEQGAAVGELARKLYPDGISALATAGGDTAVETQKLLIQRKPIFEAGFVAGQLYARVDMLVPAGKEAWDILEVKGVTQIDESHIQDCAFQKHVCEKAGLKIRKVFLVYVNKDFIKKGDVEPARFLNSEDITKLVETEQDGISAGIDVILKVAASKSKPKPVMNLPGCKPKECAYAENCIGKLPDDSVFYLYRGGEKAKQLYGKGIKKIGQIPKNEKLTVNQAIQLDCEINSRVHINKKAIKKFLLQIKEPVYFMDFETYSVTIPRFDGMKPNQNITFQFSVHILENGKLKHHSYLAPCGIDPREEFLERLKAVLGTSGTIMVYNQSFEQSRLKELGEQLTRYNKWIASLEDRYVDLLLPFRAFSFYDPVQKGSASIKKVLPAVTGKSYDDMGISNGGDASVMYYRAVTGRLENGRVKKLRENLEEYCGLDTEGMVWIVEKLRRLVKWQ